MKIQKNMLYFIYVSEKRVKLNFDLHFIRSLKSLFALSYIGIFEKYLIC